MVTQAWIQNLGHEHALTTFLSYGNIDPKQARRCYQKNWQIKFLQDPLLYSMAHGLFLRKKLNANFKLHEFEGFKALNGDKFDAFKKLKA